MMLDVHYNNISLVRYTQTYAQTWFKCYPFFLNKTFHAKKVFPKPR